MAITWFLVKVQRSWQGKGMHVPCKCYQSGVLKKRKQPCFVATLDFGFGGNIGVVAPAMQSASRNAAGSSWQRMWRSPCFFCFFLLQIINWGFEKEETATLDFRFGANIGGSGTYNAIRGIAPASRNAAGTSSSWQRMRWSRWFWQKDRRFENQFGGLGSLITVCAKCLTEEWHTNSGHRYFYGLHSWDAPVPSRWRDTMMLYIWNSFSPPASTQRHLGRVVLIWSKPLGLKFGGSFRHPPP